MTVSVIPFKKIAEFKQDLKDVVSLTAQSFVPELCQNLFACIFALSGGPIASIIHLELVTSLFIISPGFCKSSNWINCFVGVHVALYYFLCP